MPPDISALQHGFFLDDKEINNARAYVILLRMCFNPKQILKTVFKVLPLLLITVPIFAGPAAARDVSAGGVAIGDSQGGVTDRAYVTAPPNWAYVVAREAGSFLDCGEGMDAHSTDEDGRDLAPLQCGVTLTETVVIPAAAASARLTIHY